MHGKGKDFDLNIGFQYYISFKASFLLDAEEVKSQVPVEVAISVTEQGELADLSLELPKPLQKEAALEFIRAHENARYEPPRLYVVVPGKSGDTVLPAAGRLDVDGEGRILGVEIHWTPAEEAELA